jgi:hypothetical protein
MMRVRADERRYAHNPRMRTAMEERIRIQVTGSREGMIVIE